MNMQTLIAAILSLLPQNAIEVRHVEACELNHVMQPGDLEWTPRFTQLIWWGKSCGDGLYVRQWSFVSEGDIQADKNLLIFRGRIYRTDVQFESWTADDLEAIDRNRLSTEFRVPVDK